MKQEIGLLDPGRFMAACAVKPLPADAFDTTQSGLMTVALGLAVATSLLLADDPGSAGPVVQEDSFCVRPLVQ